MFFFKFYRFLKSRKMLKIFFFGGGSIFLFHILSSWVTISLHAKTRFLGLLEVH